MTTSVTHEPGRSWIHLHQELQARAAYLSTQSALDKALLTYVESIRRGSNQEATMVPTVHVDTDSLVGQYEGTPTQAATLGFLLGARLVTPSADVKAKMESSLECFARQRATQSGPSVSRDAVLLSGIGVGVAAMGGSSPANVSWITQHVTEQARMGSVPCRALALHALDRCTPAADNAWNLHASLLTTWSITTPADAIALLWALHVGGTSIPEAIRPQLETARKIALQELPFLDTEHVDALTTSMALTVTTLLLHQAMRDMTQTSLAHVSGILSRLPVALHLEEQDPRDEYDIQRVLWSMLAGQYSDLEAEQWLQRFGVHQPRADFGIPSLKLTIEAKYVRSASDFRKVQEELLADGTTYTKNKAVCEHVIAIVYDNSCSSLKQEQLRKDLSGQAGILDVITVSRVQPRPTQRKRSKTAATSKKGRPRTKAK